MTRPSPKAQALTGIMLMVFRLNGRLLERGDELVETLRINSARWQLLGAAHLAARPQTAPQIAAAMGVSRQGAQKQLNKMVAEGFFESRPNPQHARSPLYALTQKGQQTVAEASRRQTIWANSLARQMEAADLTLTLQQLQQLFQKLESPVSTKGVAE